MHAGVDIRPPFFEIGPKAYAYGRELLQLAVEADSLSERYGVQIIITPQYVDIPVIAAQVRRVLVFAQHMDSLERGRGVGSVLPEALREAGAAGVLLNHAERPLPRDELARCISRADQVGLATMVCAGDAAEALSVAQLAPNAIIVEAPESIASNAGSSGSRRSIAEADAAVWRVHSAIRVLHAAGIAGPEDVYDVIAAGAQGTGSSSAIFTAVDREAMLAAMIKATREAWDARARGEATA